jgi:hypothetical protein
MLLIALCACGGSGAAGPAPTSDAPATEVTDETAVADVTAVRTTGDAGAYTFYVTIRSDETGCDRYADWWEVLSEDGELLYRRILGHSHPSEQPFERSGGPVAVAADQQVLVRAHLAPGGYVGQVMQGSADGGFEVTEVADGFAAELEDDAPQPDGCAF